MSSEAVVGGLHPHRVRDYRGQSIPGKRGNRADSAIYQPEDQAQHNTDDDRCHDRYIQLEVTALDQDIARQPPKPEPLPDQSGNADRDQDDAEDDEEFGHLYVSVMALLGLQHVYVIMTDSESTFAKGGRDNGF